MSIHSPFETSEERLWKNSKVRGTTFVGPLPVERLHKGCFLVLEREPDNPKDPNAVKVLRVDRFGTAHIGYVGADIATMLARLMDSGMFRFCARINNVTGGTEDKENIGINISVNYTTTGLQL